jgi:hypothetical protein
VSRECINTHTITNVHGKVSILLDLQRKNSGLFNSKIVFDYIMKMFNNDEYYRISNEHYNLCSYAAKTRNLDNLKYLLKKQHTDVLCIATIHGHLHYNGIRY